MYTRNFKPPKKQSYFLFGPRGAGKTTFLKETYPDSAYIDLLEDSVFNTLLARPDQLLSYVEDRKKNLPIIIDEIQKIPALLDEVHRLIEKEKLIFILTGSSSRKLKKNGVNLLAGRAFSYSMFPLTANELGKDFNLTKALKYGMLPLAIQSTLPNKFLESYAKIYIKEEVQLEGLTRNIQAFARFLQAASFSQAGVLVPTRIAKDCAIERKVVEDYFSILQDLMLSVELPIFTKKAKRELITKRKFFFFDVGVYRTFRPKGPLDSESEINGAGLETLVLQEIRALNHYFDLNYEIYYWRTKDNKEVDFILYGEKGFKAIEVKLTSKIRDSDLDSLLLFAEDYPQAELICLYGGSKEYHYKNITIIPVEVFFKKALTILKNS